MYTEDFILRQIRLAAAAMAYAAGLKASGEFQSALSEIDRAIGQILGISPEVAGTLTDDAIREMLTHQDHIDSDRLLMVGDLFKEKGELSAILNPSDVGQPGESFWCYLRALNFYLDCALATDGEIPGLDQKINSLALILAPDGLLTDSLFSLYCYHEKMGRYAKAEAYLQEMMTGLEDAPGEKAEVKHELVSFYHRTLEKPDQAIEKGGLSRAAIQDKLNFT